MAANAYLVAWMCFRFSSWPHTARLSPPMSHWAQVTTDPCKSIHRGLDLHRIPHLSLNGPAVTTTASIAPGYDTTVTTNGSKSTLRGLDLIAHLSADPAQHCHHHHSGHSENRARQGHNHHRRWQQTWRKRLGSAAILLSPPHSASPQVTTEPSSRMAAKALWQHRIC